MPGDFNLDGKVDAADYLEWRKGKSPNPNSSADYLTWRQHFGQSNLGAGSGSGLINASVPEPHAILLAAFVPFLSLFRRRKA